MKYNINNIGKGLVLSLLVLLALPLLVVQVSCKKVTQFTTIDSAGYLAMQPNWSILQKDNARYYSADKVFFLANNNQFVFQQTDLDKWYVGNTKTGFIGNLLSTSNIGNLSQNKYEPNIFYFSNDSAIYKTLNINNNAISTNNGSVLGNLVADNKLHKSYLQSFYTTNYNTLVYCFTADLNTNITYSFTLDTLLNRDYDYDTENYVIKNNSNKTILATTFESYINGKIDQKINTYYLTTLEDGKYKLKEEFTNAKVHFLASNSTMLIISTGKKVIAYNVNTFAKLWETVVPSTGNLVLDNDNNAYGNIYENAFYMTTNNAKLIAIDLQTGKLNFATDLPSTPYLGCKVLANKIFTACTNNIFTIHNATSGAQLVKTYYPTRLSVSTGYIPFTPNKINSFEIDAANNQLIIADYEKITAFDINSFKQ